MSEDQEENNPSEDHHGTTVLEHETKNESKVKRPRKWMVIFLNDDYTPMEFVTAVLCRFFHKTMDEAVGIMMEVHNKGQSIAGVYTYEVAETKIYITSQAARQHGYPLRLIMEPVEDDE